MGRVAQPESSSTAAVDGGGAPPPAPETGRRLPSTTPKQRANPDFALRAFVRRESCGRGLTGRAVNVTKAKLEGLFADELALLHPSPGYMRLLKEPVRSIDVETYDRHAEKLREELTLVRIDRHSGQLDELDVEGVLAFAERILPRAADLWVQASLDQRKRFQLFSPDGIAFDGKRFVRTGVTAPAFSYLRETETENEGLVDLTGIEPVTS
jgi:hypothetical protein